MDRCTDERGQLDCAAAVAALLAWHAQKPAAVRRVSVEELVCELSGARHCVPAVVRGAASDLGIVLPPELRATVDGLAEVVGYSREVCTANQPSPCVRAEKWAV